MARSSATNHNVGRAHPRATRVRAKRAMFAGVRVYTVGHSTRSFEELVGLLRAFEVTRLVDIRTIPRSRTNPQFNRETLEHALPSTGISYTHLASLGGLRHARKDSPNMGFRNASFRGYADYMATEAFASGLDELKTLAQSSTLALMCAEAVPFRCHRSLVADALTVRGAEVFHIMSPTRATPHQLTRFARVHGEEITYPPEHA